MSANYLSECGKCGARRIDQQIGLEETPDAWCARLVEVFREVRRVLRPDGVCFVNIGDSYNAQQGAGYPGYGGRNVSADPGVKVRRIPGIKPKDLVGQPWMLAFALRADGWWLRGDYIWAKPNPMPESVRDRCTKAHEYVFHLSKSERYFWDAEAVREPSLDTGGNGSFAGRQGAARDTVINGGVGTPDRHPYAAGRNLRSVWTIATEPLPSIIVDGEKLDHFASYPVELARRCILAGTSAKGCCPECGAPWARVVESELVKQYECRHGGRAFGGKSNLSESWSPGTKRVTTTGWRPTCSCAAGAPEPARILDCFGGSGRTALAAEELGRDSVLIELNPASVRMAQAQIERAKARRSIGDDVTREPPDPRQGQLTLVA